jgi:hypothetical protein
LFFDASKRVAFGLCFDRADRFAVDEKKIVHLIALFQKRFANCDALRGCKID